MTPQNVFCVVRCSFFFVATQQHWHHCCQQLELFFFLLLSSRSYLRTHNSRFRHKNLFSHIYIDRTRLNMRIPLKEYSSPKSLVKKTIRRASTGSTSSNEDDGAHHDDHHSSPNAPSPDSPKQGRRKAKRSSSISFDTLDQIKTIPRYDDEQKRELFYQEFEVCSMRFDAKMVKAGIDPDNIDWRSLRWWVFYDVIYL